ncbi:hypothetical protein PaeCFBP13512_14695 [Paenibacillus sp. CFBP13512]|nr:hypothetical protein PaeCFBP13512_14695 [Paenibacillus sp. CFBP13512]
MAEKGINRPFNQRGNHKNRHYASELFRGESEQLVKTDNSVGRLLLPNPSANLVSCNKRDDNNQLRHDKMPQALVLEADEEVLF